MESGKELLSYQEINGRLCKLQMQINSRKGTEQEFCLSFIENQFREKIDGKSYRKRGEDEVDDFHLDIDVLLSLYSQLCNNLSSEVEKKTVNSTQKEIMYKTILYEYWKIRITDLDEVKNSTVLKKHIKNIQGIS